MYVTEYIIWTCTLLNILYVRVRYWIYYMYVYITEHMYVEVVRKAKSDWAVSSQQLSTL